MPSMMNDIDKFNLTNKPKTHFGNRKVLWSSILKNKHMVTLNNFLFHIIVSIVNFIVN